MSTARRSRPPEPVLGQETEYAVLFAEGEWSGRRPRAVELDEVCRKLVLLARREFPTLPDETRYGLFLGNGSRLYVDAGRHPEFSTAECSDPFELVRYALAGDRIVERLCTLVAKENPQPGPTPFLSKCNVCTTGRGSTWGCHESYLCCRPLRQMLSALIPHLVTRICYTGAGGFRAGTERGGFMVSPRVHFLRYVESADSTGKRGIVHTKDESLSDNPYHRLHLLCGEALCSEWAQVLKVGTTSLLVSLLDARAIDTSKLALARPLAAMQALTLDLDGSVRVDLEDGRRLRAIEIQRELLDLVERHLGGPLLPDWAAALCGYWRRALAVLDSDPDTAAVAFDWAIKLALYREYAGKRPVVTPKLAEIDFRFAQLGPEGIFNTFDAAGTLAHRVPEIGDVEAATEAAPKLGRAQLRGRLIRELTGNKDRYRCSWFHVLDTERERYLSMLSPYESSGRWDGPDEFGRSCGQGWLDF